MDIATITPRQQSFIFTLLDEREVDSAKGRTLDEIKARVPGLSKKDASRWIEALLARPRREAPAAVAQAAAESCGVPAGRYAVTETTHVNFFQVDRPTRGRHAGRVFVKQIVAGRADGYNIQADRRDVVLALIVEVGVERASREYGHHFGHCGFCKHDLTDKFSRFHGVGPVCRRRHGMAISEAAYRRHATLAQVAELDAWIARDQIVALEREGAHPAFAEQARLDQIQSNFDEEFARREREDRVDETPAHLA
jgi:hypothetical protein